ncbi:hypothetical protein [Pedobacter frigoris]|uniref:Ig-like domain-containing protein n=1 Tax=Pedobacter frigoris TaxID=2571272 RepID=A0A4U1CPH4_9SPHI|nr:hypothetical protein [Pedobacter frigoris]TKC09146.1 hypothetical protein FA047_03355 [Pedobacter frigoris]
MNTKSTILKTAIICLFSMFTANVHAQSISSLADFTAANASMTSLDQVICAGKKVHLETPTPPANTTYVWETRFPSADGSGTGTALAVNTGTFDEAAALAAGFYTYKLKATNTLTGCSEIYDQLVFVLPEQSVTVTAPSDVAACNNVSETFNFSSNVTGNTAAGFTFPLTYQWYTKASAGTETAVATGGTLSTLALTSPTTAESYEVYVKTTYALKSCDIVTSDKKTVTVTNGPTRPAITIAGN